MKIYLRTKVKEFIARRNWTHADFGSEIDCTASYATRLLNQEIEASPKKREKIMKVLNDYTFDDLFVILNNS